MNFIFIYLKEVLKEMKKNNFFFKFLSVIIINVRTEFNNFFNGVIC